MLIYQLPDRQFPLAVFYTQGDDMQTAEMFARLQQALDMFYAKNPGLVNGAHNSERNCAMHIGCILHGIFPEFNVDCEYHRRINIDGNEHINKELDLLKHKRYVCPDLIVHDRDTKNNLMVIEIKGHWNRNQKLWAEDELKLAGFTAQTNGTHEKFNYKLGVFVLLGRNKAYFTQYRNGQYIAPNTPLVFLDKLKKGEIK